MERSRPRKVAPLTEPRSEYQRRLGARRRAVVALAKRDALIANLRLLVFVAGIALGLAALTSGTVSVWWLAPPAVLFFVLVVIHDFAIKAKARALSAVHYYERALSRLDGTWPGSGVCGADLADDKHVYAADLDLFGRGSLFELLCTARTRAGEEVLAGWLTAPAPVVEIRARQAAVEELRHRLDLREDLALLGGDIRAEVKPAVLVRWGESLSPFGAGGWLRLIRGGAWVLTAGAVLSAIFWAVTDVGPIPLAVVAGLEGISLWSMRRKLAPVTAAVDEPKRELAVLAVVLGRLQRETWREPRLVALQQELGDTRRGASAQIRRLELLVTWLDAQRNQVFLPLAFLLLWPVHFAFAIESWRRRWGPEIRRWLAALGELEALCALAAYAFEHPADPFPELVETQTLFAGEDLRHPLLSDETCVGSSVHLGDGLQVLMVSGSNMSGKSTLLRTVGINTVLALAGAPVRAAQLRLSLLQVGATVRIVDSLAGGRSRFFAEIERLKEITESAKGRLPVLFLLDEILHGTNSHDRRIGAEAVVRGLLSTGAIGLVTTHDLALAEIAEGLGPRARNVHFSDELVAGRLVFDYRLRTGVVQTSNALALMRSVGLDVGEARGREP